ncbi:MAG: transcriptional activator RfaH, partial [Paracoccaceae bacterium]
MGPILEKIGGSVHAAVSRAAARHASHSHEATAENDHWYLVQLKPGGFERARINLARQSFVSFMPMHEVTRKKLNRFVREICPLFAGYLFVRIPPDKPHWRAINCTYGVAHLVALHVGIPTRVPAALIAGLRARCDAESRLIAAT